jgi:hypothetical protein
MQGTDTGRDTRGTGRRARVLILGAAIASMFAFASQAQAASVTVIGSPTQNIQYTAGANEVNDLGVLRDTAANRFVFREFGTAPLNAGLGCTQIDPKKVSCQRSSIVQILIALKDRDDRVRLGASHGLGDLGSACCVVSGGDGVDTLDAVFITGTGVALNGDAGNDNLIGGAGPDLFRGGTGADAMTGGDGVDEVSYSDHSVPVSVTLDRAINDGAPGVDGGTTTGADSIGSDVENISGGSAADFLEGNDDANRIFGAAGDDQLRGRANADVLTGGGGADGMLGGGGRDAVSYSDHGTAVVANLDGVANDGSPGFDGGTTTGADSIGTDVEDLIGGGGADDLTGSGQANSITGGGGSDHLNAAGGDDSVFANDGIADTVACGGGVDTAEVDLKDGPAGFASCETVTQAAVDQHPTVKIRGKRLRLHERKGGGGFVRVRLGCPKELESGCVGKLKIGARGLGKAGGLTTIGRKRYAKIHAGDSKRVRVPISKRGVRAVKRKGGLKVRVKAVERDSRGDPKVTLRTMKLKG